MFHYRRPAPRPEPYRPGHQDLRGIHFLDEGPKAQPSPQPPPPQAQPGPAPAAAAVAAKKKREFPVGLLAFAAVLGGGLMMRQAGIGPVGQTRVEEELTKAFVVEGAPRLIAETFNGSIEVTRGESDKVECVVVRSANGRDQKEAEAALSRVNVSMSKVGDTVRVVARRPEGLNWGHFGATVRVRVPEGSKLKLTTTNGKIRAEGIDGPVDARASNGTVNVKGAQGALSLVSSNGAIQCDANDAMLKAETTNGPVEFRGSLAEGTHSIRSSNGRVRLKLPAQLAFQIDAKTSNGKISTEFDVKKESGSRSKHLVGAVGDDPKVKIAVSTSNASISLVEDDE